MNVYIPSQDEIQKYTTSAVKHFWDVRNKQKKGQKVKKSEGNRGAVLGGKHLDGFVELILDVLTKNGVDPADIYTSKNLELPGFFRPTKRWDLLVIKKISPSENRFILAIELKSHVGSFGNNFNNRTEESMGSSLDIWTAFRENAFQPSPPPWLGYLMILEDSPKSTRKVKTKEPHFKVFNEFKDSSYADRYQLFAQKLVLEKNYNSACFITSSATGKPGNYNESASDLTVLKFVSSLVGHIVGAYHN
jgi:hypothetical protein